MDNLPRDELEKIRAVLARLPEAVASSRFAEKLRAKSVATGVPLYQQDPDNPEMIVRIYPDGRRERGSFVGTEFVAEERFQETDS
ncbi:MAG: hypothetical protein R3F11_22265 [Verrucomicrobiales bacterium]